MMVPMTIGIIITLGAAAVINFVHPVATACFWKILFNRKVVWGCLELVAGDNVGARAVVTVLSVVGATGFVIGGSCFPWRIPVHAVGYDALSLVYLDHFVPFQLVHLQLNSKIVSRDNGLVLINIFSRCNSNIKILSRDNGLVLINIPHIDSACGLHGFDVTNANL